jgi:hypothetical protein
MAIFGAVRADVLDFLLGCASGVRPRDEFFFREYDQADSMFVLEVYAEPFWA